MSKWILTVYAPDGAFNVEQYPTKKSATEAGTEFVAEAGEEGYSFRVDQSHTGLAIFDGLMNELLRP